MKKNNNMKTSFYNSLFCCNHTWNSVNMVSLTPVSRYITSASLYHPRYQSRSSMYIRRCLILRDFAKLAEVVPIAGIKLLWKDCLISAIFIPLIHMFRITKFHLYTRVSHLLGQDHVALCVLLFQSNEPRHVISNNVVFWQLLTQTSLCSLLLSLEAPNDVQSVA